MLLSCPPKPRLLVYDKWLTVAVLPIICALLDYWLPKPNEEVPSHITATAKTGNIENSQTHRQVSVGTKVSGKITKLYAHIGNTVKKGDLIAQIDQVGQPNNVAIPKPF